MVCCSGNAWATQILRVTVLSSWMKHTNDLCRRTFWWASYGNCRIRNRYWNWWSCLLPYRSIYSSNTLRAPNWCRSLVGSTLWKSCTPHSPSQTMWMQLCSLVYSCIAMRWALSYRGYVNSQISLALPTSHFIIPLNNGHWNLYFLSISRSPEVCSCFCLVRMTLKRCRVF